MTEILDLTGFLELVYVWASGRSDPVGSGVFLSSFSLEKIMKSARLKTHILHKS